MSVSQLDYIDYVILILMFVLCFAIGIYHGFFKGKISKTKYLVGNKNMNIFPVSMSILASILSSSAFVGRGTEVYLYGVSLVFFEFARPIVVTIYILFYLPVFYNLDISTIYEYLLLRFDKRVHLMTTILITLQTMFMVPIFLSIPALVFNEVTGVNIHIAAVVTSLVCVFYTCVGGFAAVIYTDTVQAIIMIFSISIINIKGTNFAGGFQSVWERNYDSGRLYFNIDFDLTLRYTIWALIGIIPNDMGYTCMNYSTMQRCQSVRSLKHAKSILIIYVCLAMLIFPMLAYTGLVLFATYYKCDPLTSKAVNKKDQILSYFITDQMSDVIGIRGLFLAGVFSAGLSTVSTYLNSLSGVLFQDFYVSVTNNEVSEEKGGRIMKYCVVTLGIIFTIMTLIVEKMGTIFQVTVSLAGLINGPIVGIFTIGIFLPFVTSKAVLCGTTIGFLFPLWMFIGYMFNGNKISETKPLTVEGCSNNFTIMDSTYNGNITNEGVFPLYRVTFYWYAIIGFLLTMFVSYLVSLFMERNDVSSMDPKLFSPLIKKSRIKPEIEIQAVEMKLLE